jgi:glyoxylase-like metal-dependent hydrolase (beta-lactamase superfamily II)
VLREYEILLLRIHVRDRFCKPHVVIVLTSHYHHDHAGDLERLGRAEKYMKAMDGFTAAAKHIEVLIIYI